MKESMNVAKTLSWKLNAFQIEIDEKYRYSNEYNKDAVRYRFCWDFADIVMDVLKKLDLYDERSVYYNR